MQRPQERNRLHKPKHRRHPVMILPTIQAPKGLAKGKIPDKVERRQTIPRAHIRRPPRLCELLQSLDQFIDVPCDEALLSLQALGRERVRQRLSEPSMVHVVGTEDVLAVDGGDLHFRELAVAMAVDILPGFRGGEGDFVWTGADDVAVFVMPGAKV